MNCPHHRVGFGLAVILAALMPGVASAQLLNGGFEQNSGSFASWNTRGDTLIQTSSLGTGPTEGTHDALLATATDGTINPDVPAGQGDTPANLATLLSIGGGTLASVGNGNPVLGSAIAQTLTLTAGQTVVFDWDFLTNQVYNDGTSDSYAPLVSNNDFAFMTAVRSGGATDITKLADTFYGYVNDPNAPGGFITGFAITPGANPFISETGFHSFSYQVTTSGSYTIGFGAVHVTTGADDGINSAVLIDNIRVVPEPATLLVLAAMSAGLARRRRRR